MTARAMWEEEQDRRGDGLFKSVLHHFFAARSRLGYSEASEGDERMMMRKEYHEARDEYEDEQRTSRTPR